VVLVGGCCWRPPTPADPTINRAGRSVTIRRRCPEGRRGGMQTAQGRVQAPRHHRDRRAIISRSPPPSRSPADSLASNQLLVSGTHSRNRPAFLATRSCLNNGRIRCFMSRSDIAENASVSSTRRHPRPRSANHGRSSIQKLSERQL
jgi:hypothetical protein